MGRGRGGNKEARRQMYSIHDSQLRVKNRATDRGAHEQARASTCTPADAGAVLQTSSGARGGRETVMDYRHIWAVISRSHIPPAFSGRQESCIMVSHGRPATLGCLVSVHASRASFLYLLHGAHYSAPHRPFFFLLPGSKHPNIG